MRNVWNRKWFKNLKVGEKAYRVDKEGLIWEFHKKSDCYISRCLTPTRERLPLVIHIDPPVPFKTWEDYHKSSEIDYDLCNCSICPLFGKHCKGRCWEDSS
jgi:hypothetical protein